MKLVIVSAVFVPEPLVTALISFDLANKMGNQMETIVIAPRPSRPIGFDFSIKPKINNFSLIYLNSFTHPKGSLIGRLRESISFGWESYKYLRREAFISHVYMNTWPIFGQLFVALACKSKKISYFYHMQDIYPESFTNNLPYFIQGILNKIFIKIDKYIIDNSKTTVTISENMQTYVLHTRKINFNKIITINNWQNESNFTFFYKNWDNTKFTFMYLGNIGGVAGIENVILAFANANINAKLIIAGSGSRKDSCITLANNFPNVDISFIEVPDGQVAEIQSKAHILILPTIKGGGMTSIPSKLPAYMFSGRPIFGIIDSNSDTANAILKSNSGWIIEPDDYEGIIKIFGRIPKMNKDDLKEMGLSGRKYALDNFSSSKNLDKLAKLITQ